MRFPEPKDPRRVLMGLTVLLSLMVGAGCHTPGADQNSKDIQQIDLFERLDEARLQAPTLVIKPGYPEARPHLVSGWHPKTYLVADEAAAWTLGPSAETSFFIARPRSIQIELFCAPVVPEGGEPPELTVEVNGAVVFRQVLGMGWRTYGFEVDAGLLQAGVNLLTFRHPPEATDWQPKKDTRVAWRRIEFLDEQARPPSSPKRLAEGKTLFLPVGHRIDYFLELPVGSRWRADRVVPRGGAEGIELTWLPVTEEGRDLPRRHGFQRVEDSVWIVNPAGEGRRMGRLSLGARGESGGVFVSAPRVETPFADDAVESRAIGQNPGSSQVAARPNRDAQGSRPVRQPQASQQPKASQQANVIFYLIDTLRADHLGCYGYSRPTSPNIDRFAEQAILFENARAQAPWTRASVGSVLTGLWPSVHGAEDDPDAMPEAVETLAERLSSSGFATAAFVSNGNVAEPFGFAQGFDPYRYLDPKENDGKIYRAQEVNEVFFEWLDDQPLSEDRPIFAYLHTMNPHAPYQAPEPFHSRMADRPIDPSYGSVNHLMSLALDRDRPPEDARERLIDLYDAEILANDHAFGRLLEGLEERGILDNSWVVVLSDHGEEFFDHGGWQHGHGLHVEQLAIPLLIRPPGGSPSPIRRPEVVEHVDLVPTFLDLLGLDPPDLTQGTSLRALIRPENANPSLTWDHGAVAHVRLRGITQSRLIDSTGRWKVIVGKWQGTDGFPQLYDRFEDPGELRGSTFADWPRGDYLHHKLRQLERQTPRPYTPAAADEVPESLQDQLQALGYAR